VFVMERRKKLIGLLLFRNEMRFLPGYFENVTPHVDGLIALDDGSSDGSGDFVRRQPILLDLITHSEDDRRDWNEGAKRRVLIEAAMSLHPCWFLALDADERVERHFRRRANREIRRADAKGVSAYALRLRELWDNPDTYRVDGIWGNKRRARLFASRPDREFDDRKLHGRWAPRDAAPFPHVDLIIYHLRMIDRADRRARHAKYAELDPDWTWQPTGYDYFLDEEGIELEALPPGRDYVPLG